MGWYGKWKDILVSQAVFFGLIKVLKKYGYSGFSSGLRKPDGFKYMTCCTSEAKELPVWLQLDFLEVEELPVLKGDLGEARREALEWRMVGKGVA
jgi:hypothetical protein